MSRRYASIAFSSGALRRQLAAGSLPAYGGELPIGPARGTPDVLGPREVEFLSSLELFFLASVGETGWPYVQHKGGPKGFVRVLDAHRIAFADLPGNRQFVSVGNLEHDGRVSLFCIDFASQTRLKVYGRATVVEDDPDLSRRFGRRPDEPAERVVIVDIEAFDWNCQRHIAVRFSQDEVAVIAGRLHERLLDDVTDLSNRLAEQQAENARLREELAHRTGG